MPAPLWTDVVTAISSALVPVLILVATVILTNRQDRNGELLRARVDYYRLLAPDLNRLMCYLTFIGTWKDDSPADILELKRVLDRNFYSAAPLFDSRVSQAYDRLQELSFSTFGEWGADARIASNAYRRRDAWRRSDPWQESWDAMFTMKDTDPVTKELLQQYRGAYDALLIALVKDMSLSRTRDRYTTGRVSSNAHALSRDTASVSVPPQ